MICSIATKSAVLNCYPFGNSADPCFVLGVSGARWATIVPKTCQMERKWCRKRANMTQRVPKHAKWGPGGAPEEVPTNRLRKIEA